MELGAMHVNLTGGEPFLRDLDELSQIIRNFRPSHFLVSLVSNGLSITKDKLRQIKRAGLDTLQLSIESINPQTHDEMTGIKGSFDKAIEAMNYAKELSLNVCLNAVYYSDNAEEIKKLIAFCRKMQVFLVLNTASADGRWQGENCKRLQQKDKDMFEEFMHFSHVRHDSSINFSGRKECPAGKERIHITAYGDVLTCPLVQISYGNVLEEPLKEIYKRMTCMQHIRKYNRLCKHAFDKDYYEQIILPIGKEEKRPVSIFNHPLYRSLNYEQ